MSSVNKVILIGRLGADPEVRYTQAGRSVASLRVATSENWSDGDGQRQERTEWHSITVWGKQAELCGQYLSKGRQVYLEGRLQTREYTDREGINRKAVEVVANQIVFLGGRSEGGGGGGGGWNQNQGGGGWNQNQGGGNQNQGGWNQNQGAGNTQGGWGQTQSGGNQNQGGWGQTQGGSSQTGGNQGGWGSTNTTDSSGNSGDGGDDPIPF